MPGAIGIYSPVLDAEKKSDTHFSLEGRDPKLSFEKSLQPSIEAYIGKESTQNPFISVIHGNFDSTFPPFSIHVGAKEILFGDSARLHEKLCRANVNSSLHVYDGLWHGVQEHGFKDAERVRGLISKFFKSHFPKPQTDN